MHVGAHDGVEPEARVGADDHVADDDRQLGHVGGRVDPRTVVAERRDHGAFCLATVARPRQGAAARVRRHLIWTPGRRCGNAGATTGLDRTTVYRSRGRTRDPERLCASPTATCTSSSRADLWQRYIDPAWRHAAPVGLTEMRRDMRVKVKSHVILRMGARAAAEPTRSAWKAEQRAAVRARRARRAGDPTSQREAMDAEGLDLAVLFPTPRPLRPRPRHARRWWARTASSRRLRRRDRARLQRLAARLLQRAPGPLLRRRHGGAARRRRGGRRGAALRRGARLQGRSSSSPGAVNRRPWHHPRLRSAVGRVRAPRRPGRLPRRRPELPAAGLLARGLRQADDVAHLQPAARHHDDGRQPHRRRRAASASRRSASRCSRATARGRRGSSTASTSTTSGSGGSRRPTCAMKPSEYFRRNCWLVRRGRRGDRASSTSRSSATTTSSSRPTIRTPTRSIRARSRPSSRCRCPTASKRKILWDNWSRLYDVPPPAGR